MDFGALCNFSGENYHQEINIFLKKSKASRESVRELIRSLWGLGQPFITTYKLIGPIGLYRLGCISVTRTAKGGRIRKLKNLGSLMRLTKRAFP